MKLTWRIWMLIAFLIFSLISIFSIPPQFLEKGLIVKSVEQNSSVFDLGLRAGMIIQEINGQTIETIEDYSNSMSIFSDLQEHKLDIKTKEVEIINLFSAEIVDQIQLEEIPFTRIQTGLDIRGGARALVGSEEKLTNSEVEDLIAVSQERLNIYGLSDVKLKRVSDLSGNNYMLVEIAGSTPSDLQDLIAKQGKFEAKIGNDTVFRGGDEDITYVARSGQDSGIYDCRQSSEEQWVCLFRFAISLSVDAAENYAQVTKNIPINATNPAYLEKTIDFYLDDIMTDSLLISKDLQGSDVTQHSIQGSGSGTTQKEAYDNAQQDMKKLQTVLITGSLPFKLKIVKTDQISPVLGQGFIRKIFLAGLFALIAVSLVILIRYRSWKISLALLVASISEVVIILGFASLINWNLDLPSIAGIIATIGTGVDHLIVILDESRNTSESIKERIKKALFIVMTAYFTTVVALLPLYWAGAGLLKGFAVTTLIGITTGVLITRPAFADIIKKLSN